MHDTLTVNSTAGRLSRPARSLCHYRVSTLASGHEHNQLWIELSSTALLLLLKCSWATSLMLPPRSFAFNTYSPQPEPPQDTILCIYSKHIDIVHRAQQFFGRQPVERVVARGCGCRREKNANVVKLAAQDKQLLGASSTKASEAPMVDVCPTALAVLFRYSRCATNCPSVASTPSTRSPEKLHALPW